MALSLTKGRYKKIVFLLSSENGRLPPPHRALEFIVNHHYHHHYNPNLFFNENGSDKVTVFRRIELEEGDGPEGKRRKEFSKRETLRLEEYQNSVKF